MCFSHRVQSRYFSWIAFRAYATMLFQFVAPKKMIKKHIEAVGEDVCALWQTRAVRDLRKSKTCLRCEWIYTFFFLTRSPMVPASVDNAIAPKQGQIAKNCTSTKGGGGEQDMEKMRKKYFCFSNIFFSWTGYADVFYTKEGSRIRKRGKVDKRVIYNDTF